MFFLLCFFFSLLFVQAAVSLVRDAPDEDAAGGAKANPGTGYGELRAVVAVLQIFLCGPWTA